MDYNFFENLNKKEAELYLKNYLDETEIGFNKIKEEMEEAGINVDFSIQSLFVVFDWIFKKVKIDSFSKPDEKLPKWILETDEYKKGLYNFDENTNVLILRYSYYFGECFKRKYNDLFWSYGQRKTALQNMPVVKGFIKKLEMPTLVICENLFSKVYDGKKSEMELKQCINYWTSFIN